MVEMLVALAFTMVLMAGMATVFKASLSTFFTSGEALSSSRRNVMSVNLLAADLDTACMYLTDLSDPPPATTNFPPFFILPNQPVVNPPAAPGAGDPTIADELYFQLDVPLPFTATLQTAGGSANSASQVVANGGALAANNGDNTFDLECGSSAYAGQVAAGQTAIFMDSFEVGTISGTPKMVTTTEVQVVLGASGTSATTGLGATGLPLKAAHLNNTQVLLVQTGNVIRYSVQYLLLDPANTNGIPCLVRDQGTVAGGGFTPIAALQQIVTENVSGFKVYLSVNSGKTWAGQGITDAGVKGWTGGTFGSITGGILSELNTQLGSTVSNGFVAIAGNDNWFRSIPTLVRVDLTTRTAAQRTEYNASYDPKNPKAAFKTLTQTIILVPRHSGLPMS
jgi:hypothetical protein